MPDLVGDDVRLLFVGINPGLRAMAMQAPFAGANRFYPALFAAGIVDRHIDVSAGLTPEDRDHLLGQGLGITSLVARATAAADELTHQELTAGVPQLAAKVARIKPTIVAILGITVYRTVFATPRGTLGRQSQTLSGRTLWVLPNPSGRNAHAPLPVLARTYREAAAAAGVQLFGR